MTTQAPAASQDLAAARELLDKLDAATRSAETDSQTSAITAATHAILVLAEQVAAIRVLIVQDAMARQAAVQPVPPNGRPAGQDGQSAAQDSQPAVQNGQPAADDGQPAPEATDRRRKRWW